MFCLYYSNCFTYRINRDLQHPVPKMHHTPLTHVVRTEEASLGNFGLRTFHTDSRTLAALPRRMMRRVRPVWILGSKHSVIYEPLSISANILVTELLTDTKLLSNL